MSRHLVREVLAIIRGEGRGGTSLWGVAFVGRRGVSIVFFCP
jgi:hypothetical protein